MRSVLNFIHTLHITAVCKKADKISFFGPCIFIIEGRTDQQNAQINFSLINLLLFKLL